MVWNLFIKDLPDASVADTYQIVFHHNQVGMSTEVAELRSLCSSDGRWALV